MITLKDVAKTIGSRTLFQDATLTFHQGHRYGLTGPNGAGKSTLFRMIMQEEELSAGSIKTPPSTSMLRQNIEPFLEHKVLDVVIMGNDRLWSALQERDSLYEGEMTDEVGMRLGDLEGVIAEEDGYAADTNAAMLLEGIGIESSFHEMEMREIPTDFQFRVLLCQALFGEPQALLLDEPTNHLDLESIGWLEEFLEKYRGTLIVTSHDRHFLNSITTDIADIDYETIILYPGNYDDMLHAKTSVRSTVEMENKAKEQKIAKLQEFVAKFGAGSRASQVQSRKKEIARLEPRELKQSNIQRPYIRFSLPETPPGQIIFSAENLQKSYEDNHVIRGLSFEISRGNKVGIIGNNGQGKTTLLKLLTSHLEADQGSIKLGHNVSIGYFPQNHSDVLDKDGKEGDLSIYEWLNSKNPGHYEQEVRGALGKMLFSGDDAFKKIHALSGGETARLLLANMILQKHNTLILDEPNNHLDIESVSALSWALQDFKGTLLIVSHDRDLINSCADKIIAFEQHIPHVYEGGLNDYLAAKSAKKS